MDLNDLTVRQLSRKHALRLALVTETFPPEINGVAMTLGKIAEGLDQRGHAIQLIRPQQQSDVSSEAPRSSFTQTLVRGLPIPHYEGLRFGLPARKFLTEVWQTNRPDLVHVATEGPLGWSAIMAARHLKIPVTSSFHTHFEHYSTHYGLGWLKQPVISYLRKLHNRTDATFVPTYATEVALQAQGYRNLHVLSRGVDADLFNPLLRSQTLRQQWGIGKEELAILHVGRMAPEKNLSLVEQAFAAIQQRHPKARMIWVGDGPSRSELATRHPQHIFTGHQTGRDLATLYASADLFLFASQTETFGNVVLEAMASGVPTVAFACAAAAQLIRSGHSGILIPPADEGQFIVESVRLAADPSLRQAMRQAARNTASTLSWEHIFDALESHFQRIIRKTHRLRAHEESFIHLLPI